MTKLAKTSALIFLIAMVVLATSCSKKEAQDLLFFYFESCPSCDDYKLAEDFNDNLLKLNKNAEWNAQHYNLITPEAGEELKKILSIKGMPDISRSLPLLIIGNEYINGYENIGKKLEEILSEE